jgi:hypothetical protein
LVIIWSLRIPDCDNCLEFEQTQGATDAFRCAERFDHQEPTSWKSVRADRIANRLPADTYSPGKDISSDDFAYVGGFVHTPSGNTFFMYGLDTFIRNIHFSCIGTNCGP